MADDKPKHKPQKKRTLEEVLKSLQDLIRSDLVSATPGSFRGTAHRTSTLPITADEPDTFQDALHKLDEIIKKKIIEPVERARETPPAPLLPDEEIEITWNEAPVPPDVGNRDEIVIDDIDSIEWDTDTASSNEETPAETPPEVVPVAVAEPEPTPPEFVPPDEIAESIVIESLEAPSVEFIDADSGQNGSTAGTMMLEPEAEPTDATPGSPDPQQMFDFTAPRSIVIAPPEPKRTESTPVESVPPERPPDSAAPVVEPNVRENPIALIDTTSADDAIEPTNLVAEQDRGAAVELDSPRTDGFTVEYTVGADSGALPDASASLETGIASQPDPRNDVISYPTEQLTVKDNPDSNRSADRTSHKRPADKKPAEPAVPDTIQVDESPADAQIPILKDVADLQAPPSPPLPDVSQARDIAIRVIARLNIERRKSGEAPLDIKTIERLQQYLADALGKRALNKPK